MIKLYNIVLKDSPCGNPFAPHKKEIDPIVGAGIIMGVSSLLGSLFSAGSQSSANKTNLSIAESNLQAQRETNLTNQNIADKTNAMNRLMMQEQNAFNLDMWNKENAYNDPRAQVQRLLAAGINPASGLGQVSQASQLSSADWAGAQASYNTAPQLNYHQNPINYDFSGVGNAMMQAVGMKQSQMVSASQANYNNAKADYERASAMSRLQQEVNKAKFGTVEYDQAKRNLDLFNETYDAQKRASENTAEMSDREIQRIDVEIATKKIEQSIMSINEKWLDKMNSAQYNALVTGIKETYSRIAVNDSEAALKAAQTAVENAREEGLKISNEQADQLVESIVDKAHYEALQSQKIYMAGNKASSLLPLGTVEADNVTRSLNDHLRRKRHRERK